MQSMATLLLTLFSFLTQAPANLPHAFPREGAKQILENERIIMWDVTWVTQSTGMHRHKYDLVAVDLNNSKVKITTPDGKTTEGSQVPGQVIFQLKDVTHAEEGVSGPRHAIIFDLKEVKIPPIKNTSTFPTAFPREGAKKLVDNERVTIWDYTWTPGKLVATHFHDKDVVAVFLTEGELESVTPDGKSEVLKIHNGMARFNPKGRAHAEKLIKGQARAIITEFK